MKKLLNGIIDFRRNRRPDYRETFARLALGQRPDALFVACSDSRMVPNLFASTDPGDLFVIRNVGNLIPPCAHQGMAERDDAEGAAIEFSLKTLPVGDIVVCGHSECGAMQAVLKGEVPEGACHLHSWLRHGRAALERLQQDAAPDPALAPHNRLSQLNVLQQIEHLKSYPDVSHRLANGTLRLHAWWFDIARAEVLAYNHHSRGFVLLDETEAERMLVESD